MSTLLGEGQTRWFNCPRCDEIVLEAETGGVESRLSRFSVPLSHAMVLGLYPICLWHVWRGQQRWFVTEWFPVDGPPKRGSVHMQHDCILRK